MFAKATAPKLWSLSAQAVGWGWCLILPSPWWFFSAKLVGENSVSAVGGVQP